MTSLVETMEALLKKYADPDGKVRGDKRYAYLRAFSMELKSGRWTAWDVEELMKKMKDENFGKPTVQ